MVFHSSCACTTSLARSLRESSATGFRFRRGRALGRDVGCELSHPREKSAASDGGEECPQPSLVLNRPAFLAEPTNNLDPDGLNDVRRVEFGTQLIGKLASNQGRANKERKNQRAAPRPGCRRGRDDRSGHQPADRAFRRSHSLIAEAEPNASRAGRSGRFVAA